MNDVIMIGCDLHDVSMVLKLARGTEASVRKTWATKDPDGLIVYLKDYAEKKKAQRIVFAYEASGQGFGLYDRLTEAGIECHVLAPTHLPHTAHHRKRKTDDADAEMILDEVRAHVLAGRKLPDVWVPDPQTRADRELIRMRLEIGEQRTRIKNQIRNLAKRYAREFPEFPNWFTKSGEWSKRSVAWLRAVAGGKEGALPATVQVSLSSLIDLHEELCRQKQLLEKAILSLAKTERYARPFRKLKLQSGVGALTAMTFLTELGDLARFANRRQLAAYLGLIPTAHESGNCDDRKGHITRQGPARLRHVLCQAAWAALRCSPGWRERYDRIKRGSNKRSKIAIVAVMRQLAIAMWHAARSPDLDPILDEQDRLEQERRSRPRKKIRKGKDTLEGVNC